VEAARSSIKAVGGKQRAAGKRP